MRIANGLRDVAIESIDATKAIAVEYALGGIDEARTVALTSLRVGKRGGMALRTSDDLSSFDIEGGQPEHPIAVELTATRPGGERRERFDSGAHRRPGQRVLRRRVGATRARQSAGTTI